MKNKRYGGNSRQKRLRRRKRQRLLRQLPVYVIGLLIIGILAGGAFRLSGYVLRIMEKNDGQEQTLPENGGDSETTPDGSLPDESLPEENQEPETGAPETLSAVDTLLNEASLAAAGYDYDKAIDLLQSSPFAGTDQQVADAIANYESIRTTLQPADYHTITHVFFHSLIMDESKAFDGDADEAGYNQVMTTKDEFLKILDSMYEKGYVLVRLHDIALMTEREDGTMHMTPQQILLPEGKKACVMSQDDVCYYPYMTGDGFATRMIIGEDGKPTCEMVMDDGSVSVGAYDLVPLLEEFIQEHPDFSYRGARAVIAFTGYEGILGYRTSSSYSDSPTYEQDRQAAAAVAQCLRDNGWELASHSWGHRDMGTISYENFKTDCDKWENEVASLIGDTDIILFPFGADISDWHPYNHENERFNYLKSLGFDYFCNVDSNQYWVQLGTDYIRQGRRNLDGYRMWKDIEAGSDTGSRKLDDLFHAEDVFSPNRPTPVEWS